MKYKSILSVTILLIITALAYGFPFRWQECKNTVLTHTIESGQYSNVIL